MRRKHVSNERTKQHPEKEINKMRTSNLLDAKFKTLVIWMLSKLRRRIDEFCDTFNKDKNHSKRTSQK